MKLFHRVRHTLEIKRREREAVRELARLGDRELADLGLARADIRDVARLAAQTEPLAIYAYHYLRAALDAPARGDARAAADEGFLRKRVRRVWARAGERIRYQIRYSRALHQLHKLDERDLDDLNLARVDFPELAHRHATGAPAVARLHG